MLALRDWLYRSDEQARDTWCWLTSPSGPRASGKMLGRVLRVYQRAQTGSKVIVAFEPPVNPQDTWWPGQCPKKGTWVLVAAHLWQPPGTHSGHPVWWIDQVAGVWPGNLERRAARFERLQAQGPLGP